MKVSLITLALIGFGCAAPQPRKLFHEHFDDFVAVIAEEAGGDLDELGEHYSNYDDFQLAIDYMTTNSFKDLVAEMEDLPEFKAVVEFLEKDNIDIMYFIDLFHVMLDDISGFKRSSRLETSGTDFTSFINDVIAVLPKAKLAALFDEKMSTDEEFRISMENLRSSEWDAVFEALWVSEVFQAEVKTLAENGIDISLLYLEVLAIFGQN